MGTRRKVGENKHSQGGTNDRKAQVLSFLHMQLHLLSANPNPSPSGGVMVSTIEHPIAAWVHGFVITSEFLW
jgi:hypothetical protein